MKFYSLTFVLFIFLSNHSSATELDIGTIFQKPFIFGASISAGYGGAIDGLIARSAAKKEKLYFGGNTDPATRLAFQFNDYPEVTNISEMVGSYPNQSFGHLQFYQATRDPVLSYRLETATVWVSLDGFYWPSIMGACTAAEQGLLDIINTAAELQKPLVLANIPDDDPKKVSGILKLAGWKAPQPDCLKKLNQTMQNSCRRDTNCYLVNLHDAVELLNTTGLTFNGRLYRTKQFRFDGIHLTKVGIEWLMTEIILQMWPETKFSDNFKSYVGRSF